MLKHLLDVVIIKCRVSWVHYCACCVHLDLLLYVEAALSKCSFPLAQYSNKIMTSSGLMAKLFFFGDGYFPFRDLQLRTLRESLRIAHDTFQQLWSKRFFYYFMKASREEGRYPFLSYYFSEPQVHFNDMHFRPPTQLFSITYGRQCYRDGLRQLQEVA